MACDPVGRGEIAERLGLHPKTPSVWVQRGLLPKPRWTVNGGDAWNWSDIQQWARETGRVRRPRKDA